MPYPVIARYSDALAIRYKKPIVGTVLVLVSLAQGYKPTTGGRITKQKSGLFVGVGCRAISVWNIYIHEQGRVQQIIYAFKV
jgi:hypothetical protein